MCHDRFLNHLGEPVGNKKRALFRVVVSCRLFSQEVIHKLLETKIWGDEPPLHHGFTLGFPLRWRQLGLDQCLHLLADLLTIAHRTLDGGLELQMPQAHDALQYFIKSGEQRLRRRISHRDSRHVESDKESATQHTETAGETRQVMSHKLAHSLLIAFIA